MFFNIVVFSPCMYKKRLRRNRQTGRQTGLYSRVRAERQTDGSGVEGGETPSRQQDEVGLWIIVHKGNERLLAAVISQSAVINQLEIRSSLYMSSL